MPIQTIAEYIESDEFKRSLTDVGAPPAKPKPKPVEVEAPADEPEGEPE